MIVDLLLTHAFFKLSFLFQTFFCQLLHGTRADIHDLDRSDSFCALFHDPVGLLVLFLQLVQILRKNLGFRLKGLLERHNGRQVCHGR